MEQQHQTRLYRTMLFNTLCFIYVLMLYFTFFAGSQLVAFLIKRRNNYCWTQVEKLHVKNLRDIPILKSLLKTSTKLIKLKLVLTSLRCNKCHSPDSW